MGNFANPKTGADSVNFSTLMTLAYEHAAFDLRLNKLSESYSNLEFVVVNMLEKIHIKKFKRK